MKRFLIATNFIKDENLSLTSKVERYLEEHGASSTRINGQQGDYSAWIPQEEHAGSYDCVIALGGDGTILKVSRDLRHLNIPIVGVNLGTLGFLAEIEPEQIYPVLDRLLADDYELEERMNICGSVFKCGAKEPLLKDVALNDIVVSRTQSVCKWQSNGYI